MFSLYPKSISVNFNPIKSRFIGRSYSNAKILNQDVPSKLWLLNSPEDPATKPSPLEVTPIPIYILVFPGPLKINAASNHSLKKV